ncbi:MAG: hypothetical protein H8E12_14720 [Rhodobacteraceae bacterium]|nr:hypothetical protein [Paracoccaceae bacterium]
MYTASLILGTELDNSGAILASTTGNVTTDVSITEFTGGGISTPNLKKAEDEISSAIDILFGGKYSEMLDRANSVFNSAGLSLNGSNNFGQVHIPDGLFTDIEFASELGIPELDYLNHEYNDGNTVIALT